MKQLFDSMEQPEQRVRVRASALRWMSFWNARAFDCSNNTLLFAVLLVAVIAAGLARSWWATRLDSPQIDETWHTVAGVSYVRTGDFRLNPEHPPLVKLWVGATMPARYVLPPFRALDDKTDERKFVDETHALANNSEWAQRHMRISMCAFNAVLLFALGFCLRRAFGSSLALIATALLLIDPTVAAHVPLVLTDLPVTLLASITMLQALFAFRAWRARDLLLASLALGLSLATKHSALVIGLAVLLLGLLSGARHLRASARLTRISAVFLGAYAVLWGCYGFHFDERGARSAITAEAATFNRSLDDKVMDLSLASSRAPIQLAVEWRLLPKAYLWGLADIARVAIEGRNDTLVLGKWYRGETPWFFFPLTIAAKLPLGQLCFALAGVVCLAQRRTRAEHTLPLTVLLGWSALHLLLLMRGNSGYAGIRHALPIFPAIAVLASLPVFLAHSTRSRSLVAGGLALTLATALPVVRPWEYYNELVGGAANAWHSFSDEGVDSGQRGLELVRYYDKHLRGTNEPVYDFYGLCEPDVKAYKLELAKVGADPDDVSQKLVGTVFVSTVALVPTPTYDHASFREAKPVARFGNLLVLKGELDVPWLAADRKTTAAAEAMFQEPPDKDRAEKLLSEVAVIYPEDYQSSFELANLRLERGDKKGATEAYNLSLKYARGINQSAVDQLTRQIQALEREQSVSPIRPSWLE